MKREQILRHGVSLALVGLVFLIRTPIEAWAGVGASPILYLPAVTLAAWYGGFGAGVASVVLWALLWVYFDVEPSGSLQIPSMKDQFRVVVFFIEGLFISASMEMLNAARRSSDEYAREAERYRMASGRNEAQLRAILENSPAPIWLKDVEGRYLLFNRRFEALVSRSGQEVVGKTDTDLFLPRIAEPLHANDRAVLELGQAVEVEQTLWIEDRPHTFLSVKFPLVDTRGVPYAIGGIFTDITELKEAQRRAVQSERLAAIGQMMTGLAHESRNALQRSQACLEMLAFRLEGRPEALDLVDGIQRAQDDLQRLYEEVRCYAAPIHLDRREHRLKDLVREAWDHLGLVRLDRSSRVVHQGMDDPRCVVDRHRMVQVFRNVLDNALAACPDPVVIEVEWSESDLDGRAAVRVSLRDNGPGLSREDRKNLFEPFYTTKTQGTGLGMAITRRIVEAHEGKIGIGVGVGVGDRPGAEIDITLPVGTP